MRHLLRLSLVLLLFILVGAGWLYHRARTAEPLYAGALQLPGLAQRVSVDFDRHAVPHVQAPDLHSLIFAQGYLMATERMWQMDLLRRVARGRLSEVMGERTLPADRLFRTLGLEQAARRNLQATSPTGRRLLQSFSQGVNAYIQHPRTLLPLEYLLAGFEPEPWEPLDSLAIGEFMVASLSFNVREELMYLRLAQRLGPERAAELFPSDAGLPAPVDVPDLPDAAPIAANLTRLIRQYESIARSLGLPLAGAASNAWAVAGSRTADGHALLANDPHLSPTMPGIWFEMELQSPQLHAAGICLPGTPFIMIGHNPDLAWGLTTVMADTQDLFLERPSPDGRAVIRPGGQTEALRYRSEIIAVKGRQKGETLEIRSTRNGVVLNDVLGRATDSPLDLPDQKSPYLIALRWNTELADTVVDGLLDLNTATSIAQGRAAARRFLHVSQNFVFAHRDGSIGWQISGALPKRRGASGAFPQLGWDSGSGWEGFYDSEYNPGTFSPPDDVLVSANHRSLPWHEAGRVGHFWMPAYRAQRIQELLDATDSLDADDFQNIQMDRHSLEARNLLQRLKVLQREISDKDPGAGRMVDFLLDWDGSMDIDSPQAALSVWLRPELFRALLQDELGADLDDYMRNAVESYNALHQAIDSGRSPFWDDVSTQEEETAADVFVKALNSTWEKAAELHGDPRTARLGELRRLVFPHAFHKIPGLARLFDVGPVAAGGDDHTVNVMKSLPEDPATPAYVASYRLLVTPGDWNQSRGSNTLGQSGHRFSPYRTDQFEDWYQGRLHSWHWGRVPEDELMGRLYLKP